MNGVTEVIASTTFPPGNPPAEAYMRNCYGNAITDVVPGRSGVGDYFVTVPPSSGIDLTTPAGLKSSAVSVTARAYNAAGAVRNVNVGLSINLGDSSTNVAIRVRDDLGALTDDFVRCEVTISRLPLV
jgi:hypothetical protein